MEAAAVLLVQVPQRQQVAVAALVWLVPVAQGLARRLAQRELTEALLAEREVAQLLHRQTSAAAQVAAVDRPA